MNHDPFRTINAAWFLPIFVICMTGILIILTLDLLGLTDTLSKRPTHSYAITAMNTFIVAAVTSVVIVAILFLAEFLK